MLMNRTAFALVVALACVASTPRASAQTRPAWGRVSIFGDGSSTTQDGGLQSSFSELIANVTFESATGEDVKYEYRADIRLAGYPGSADRTRRASIYDAYAGVRLAGGAIGLRAGEMWLNDLGGLGSIGGAMVEVRQRARTGGGRWRAALFGGLEPLVQNVGFESHVLKVGGLLAYDGEGMRRHVVGFVHIRDNGVTERSVFVFTNFLPIDKRLFVYQSAEYDVGGPGISGAGSLTYFFANGRYAPNDRVEFQGTYHRGRSIDSRSIVRDQLDGRPIDPKALDGLRFESVTGRVTVSLGRGLRVFGGYGQDRNNRDDAVSGRITYGLFASNVLRTGLDVNASDSRIDRGASGSYDSWYVSVGRSLGGRVYVTGDYSSSLSVFHFTSASGFLIDTRPRTRRFSASSVINIPHGTSLLFTAERVIDSTAAQTRFLSGLTFRF
jgi:hypothetical protein